MATSFVTGVFKAYNYDAFMEIKTECKVCEPKGMGFESIQDPVGVGFSSFPPYLFEMKLLKSRKATALRPCRRF